MPVDPPSRSRDPRHELISYAELLARLARPFADRHSELAAARLTEADLTGLQSTWVDTLLRDEVARAAFENAYVEQVRALQTVAELGVEPPLLESPNTLAEVDPDETLPISAPLVHATPNPFRRGDYKPPPPLARSRQTARAADDPDATRLPMPTTETLPFTKPMPSSSTDPRKKR